MMRGRPKKPAKLKILEGNLGKVAKASLADLPAPEGKLDLPKAWRSRLSIEEVEAWDMHVESVRSLGLESRVDIGEFRSMVVFYCRAIAADEHIRKYGLVLDLPLKGMVANPAVNISLHAWKSYAQFANQFGLSPSARAKFGPMKPAGEDDAASAPLKLVRD